VDLQGDRDPQVGDGNAVVGEAQLGDIDEVPAMVVWLSSAIKALLR
jgi:hypothetical protein